MLLGRSCQQVPACLLVKRRCYIYIYIYMYMVTPPLESTTPKFLEFPKIQNSKNPNPSFGFLETRAGASKSKNRAPARVSKIPKIQKPQPMFRIFGNSSGSLQIQNSSSLSSFQNSKNPKTPTQVSDFWKLEREPQNPKIALPLEFPEIPKTQKIHPKVWIFGNSSGSLKMQESPSRSSFRNSKNPKKPTPRFGFLDTRAGARILDFEAPARVSKNPKLGLGFLGFWKFGNSRNFGLWVSRSSFQTSGSSIFGF